MMVVNEVLSDSGKGLNGGVSYYCPLWMIVETYWLGARQKRQTTAMALALDGCKGCRGDTRSFSKRRNSVVDRTEY